MQFYQSAFEEVCKKAKPPKGVYVVLIEHVPFYGGPEEGGWWGEDYEVAAFQYFLSTIEAKNAYKQILLLAQELEDKAQLEYGERCLREMEFLEERGLDDDSGPFPEPDGPSTFSVIISKSLPRSHRGNRQWS